jgi:protein-tyrosine phosphatase
VRFFRRKSSLNIEVDIHSHLIPNIDDGAKSIDESIEMLSALYDLGYKKVITTPHIHPSYPNTPDKIKAGLQKVIDAIEEKKLAISIEAAAEYFVDEVFLNQVQQNKEILSFGKKLVLVESSFLNKPIFFEEALFELKVKGYTPVLAHPERYQFLEGSIDWLHEMKNMGVLLQVTLGSLGGYYGEIPQRISKELIKNKMVDLLGSDLHKITQVDFLKKGLEMKETQNYLNQGLCRNKELL